MKSTAQRLVIGLSVTLFLAVFLAVGNPSAAYGSSLQSTPVPMPTAGADGRILYTILAGESQFSIAAKFGIPIETLQSLNNWTGDETINEGQVILLGLVSQEQATPTVGPTSEVVATLTPEGPAGTGRICVLLFDDVNGDALRQETEFGIADGQASVGGRPPLPSNSGTTVAALDEDGAPVPVCFEGLPPGEYTISVAIPQGYNSTTAANTTIVLNSGDDTSLNFGAQAGSSSGFNVLSPEEGGRSPLMGLLGIVLLLSGAGLGFYTMQMRRR